MSNEEQIRRSAEEHWTVRSLKDITKFFAVCVSPQQAKEFWGNFSDTLAFIEKMRYDDLAEISSKYPSSKTNLYTVAGLHMGLKQITDKKSGKKMRITTKKHLQQALEVYKKIAPVVSKKSKVELFAKILLDQTDSPRSTDFRGIKQFLLDKFPIASQENLDKLLSEDDGTNKGQEEIKNQVRSVSKDQKPPRAKPLSTPPPESLPSEEEKLPDVSVTTTNNEELVEMLFNSIPIKSTQDFIKFVKSMSIDERIKLFDISYDLIMCGLNRNDLDRIKMIFPTSQHNLYTCVAKALNFDNLVRERRQKSNLLAENIKSEQQLTELLNLLPGVSPMKIKNTLARSKNMEYTSEYKHPIQLAYRLAPDAKRYEPNASLPKLPTTTQLNGVSDSDCLKEAIGMMFMVYNSSIEEIITFVSHYAEYNFIKSLFDEKYLEITEMLSDEDLKMFAEKMKGLGASSPNLYYLTAKKLNEEGGLPDNNHLKVEKDTTREALEREHLTSELMSTRSGSSPYTPYEFAQLEDSKNNPYKVMIRLIK